MHLFFWQLPQFFSFWQMPMNFKNLELIVMVISAMPVLMWHSKRICSRFLCFTPAEREKELKRCVFFSRLIATGPLLTSTSQSFLPRPSPQKNLRDSPSCLGKQKRGRKRSRILQTLGKLLGIICHCQSPDNESWHPLFLISSSAVVQLWQMCYR